MKKRIKRICACAVFMCAAVYCAVCSDIAQGASMPEKTVPPDLYGAYWGEMTMFFSAFKTCVTLDENEVVLYSTKKTRSYPQITYSDNGDGTWLVRAYASKKIPGKHKPNVTVLVNTQTAPYSAKITIVAMNKNIDCVKGKPYDFSLKK